MSLKSFIIKQVSGLIAGQINSWKKTAVKDQNRIRQTLISKAKNTAFGKDHHFDQITNYNDFKKAVPIRDYEGLRTYIDRVTKGEADILWPGKPKYFAKTSGTTSGVKYIPITHESMPNHIVSARNAMLNYFHQKGSASVFEGKVIFLSKLEKIVDETIHEDMRLISGIPPWVQMYYERLLARSGRKTVREVFPNYSLFMYGGVNFEPYRAKLEELVGGRIDSIETFPASEGFIAFQDDVNESGLLLNTNSGIFFEFVPVESLNNPQPVRLMIDEVELNKDYALIINNNAGLWGYNIGDCVRFVSLDPYKLIVSGRVKHYISAFGEHVIGKEVEEALLSVSKEHNVSIIEFTVAPQVNPQDGSVPFHEWFIEFDKAPKDLAAFALEVDKAMCDQNIYYDDLIKGHILRPLVIRPMSKDAFREYMKTQGKLGGQNKVPRLSNDRKIADQLLTWIDK
ncbi:MAG: GH3 auxin-responsive promoter family protein [Saprospiraceae bacterium]|nr:GH3 auxin-responsive promoter family protein [Saprospiraceae bacterium]